MHVEQLGRLVLVFDGDRVIRAVSRPLALVLGWEPAELVGASLDSIVKVSSPERIERLLRELEATGVLSATTTLVTSAGEELPFAYTTRAVAGAAEGFYVSSGELLEWSSAVAHELAHAALDGNGDEGSRWLTKAEVVGYSRHSARSIDRAVTGGELAAGGTPGRRLFRKSDVDAWLTRGGGVALLVAVGLVLAQLGDLLEPGGGFWIR